MSVLSYIELAGTIAFAISGAVVGTKKGMDVFGVCILGVTTACGGGMIRDVILGNVPSSLVHPKNVLISIATSLIVFAIVYIFNENLSKSKFKNLYENIVMMMDSFGLGIFTVMGMNTGIENGYGENTFLLIFLGVLTGVGGGLLRDMMANTKPYILTEDIYACASIVGAVCGLWLFRNFGVISAVIISIMIVVILRGLAIHFKWNLPSIKVN